MTVKFAENKSRNKKPGRIKQTLTSAIDKILNSTAPKSTRASQPRERARFPKTEIGEFIVGICGRGSRIQLIKDLDDRFTPIHAGTMGTVDHVDDAGQIHVKWDTGQRLALIPGVDQFKVFR